MTSAAAFLSASGESAISQYESVQNAIRRNAMGQNGIGQNVIGQSAASAVSQNGNSPGASSTSDSLKAQKLRQAAAEFEGMLLSSLWKSMKSTFSTPDDDDSTDPAHDTFNDWSIEAMSNAVGKAGGLGLGKLILKHLEPMLANSQNENAPNPGKAPGPSADIPSEWP